MKQEVEKRKPSGVADYFALAMTTVGVGYLPLAPGTWGSMVGVGIYLLISWVETTVASHGGARAITSEHAAAFHWTLNSVMLTAYCLLGVWASGRSIPLLGNEDPPEAVVDEVMGQLITFAFIPFGLAWPFVLAGFLLFRIFDIWKPYPIDDLQGLPGGLGVCADDVVAGVFAGVCLSIGYLVYTAL